MTERQSVSGPSAPARARSPGEHARRSARASAKSGSRRATQAAERRAALLAAAEACFVAQGWEATSVASIVARAGVAQGTFYLYFSSKEQILAHLRVRVLEQWVRAFTRGQSRGTRADERLVRGLSQVASAVRKSRALVAVFRRASSQEATERVWAEGRQTFVTPLAELIELGRAQGDFRSEDPVLSAHLLLSLFDDLLYEAAAHQRPASLSVTLEHATRFCLRGLGVAERRITTLLALTHPKKP